MSIYIGDKEIKDLKIGTTTPSAVYLGDTKIRPSGPDQDYLCFTAEQANSTVQLTKNGNPTAVNLETSEDGQTWATYTIGNTITLTNVGDKVYWRNTSTTDNRPVNWSNYYKFVMTGSIAASGDVNFLINKNSTQILTIDYCFHNLFYLCTSLTSTPELPATTLSAQCYRGMFASCTSLTTATRLPATVLTTACYMSMFTHCPLTTIIELPATVLTDSCYYDMFNGCSSIKLSTTKTGEYQTEYRIPTTGTGTTASSWNNNMFANTGGTFKGAPNINTTYYTSNTVV